MGFEGEALGIVFPLRKMRFRAEQVEQAEETLGTFRARQNTLPSS